MVSGSGHDPDVTARSSPPDRPRPTVVELDLIVEVLVCAHRRGGDLFVLLRRYGGQGEQAQPCCGDHVRPKLTRDTSGREAGGPRSVPCTPPRIEPIYDRAADSAQWARITP